MTARIFSRPLSATSGGGASTTVHVFYAEEGTNNTAWSEVKNRGMSFPPDHVYVFTAIAQRTGTAIPSSATFSAPAGRVRIDDGKAVLTGKAKGNGGQYLNGTPYPNPPGPPAGTIKLGPARFTGPFNNITDIHTLNLSNGAVDFKYAGSNSKQPDPEKFTSDKSFKMGNEMPIQVDLNLIWAEKPFYYPVSSEVEGVAEAAHLLQVVATQDKTDLYDHSILIGGVPVGELFGTSIGGTDNVTHPNAVMVPYSETRTVQLTASPNSLARYDTMFTVSGGGLTVVPSEPFPVAASVTVVGDAFGEHPLTATVEGAIAQCDAVVKVKLTRSVALIEVALVDSAGKPVWGKTSVPGNYAPAVGHAPNPQALESYLNGIYEWQTNVHFDVDRNIWRISLNLLNDKGRVSRFAWRDEVSDWLKQSPQKDQLKNKFLLFYVWDYGPGAEGETPDGNALSMISSQLPADYGLHTAAHELGHAQGLNHPWDNTGLAWLLGVPDSAPARLMGYGSHTSFGSRLIKAEWDIINYVQ